MSRKTNRDHAKKKQRLMVEDQVIAEHLTSLLTPAMKSQSSLSRELGLRDESRYLDLDSAHLSSIAKKG